MYVLHMKMSDLSCLSNFCQNLRQGLSQNKFCAVHLYHYLKVICKPLSKFDSYRAIAGASQLLQLFEHVILILLRARLSTDSLQFGFKKGVGNTQCSWLVTEAANYCMERGTEVMACILTAAKRSTNVCMTNCSYKCKQKVFLLW